jgi:hypothetical protein
LHPAAAPKKYRYEVTNVTTTKSLAAIERGIGGDFRINEEAEPIGKHTSMSWFRTQFGAEGITYEIGDGTDRDFVRRKGLVSAEALIEVLLVR